MKAREHRAEPPVPATTAILVLHLTFDLARALSLSLTPRGQRKKATETDETVFAKRARASVLPPRGVVLNDRQRRAWTLLGFAKCHAERELGSRCKRHGESRLGD